MKTLAEITQSIRSENKSLPFCEIKGLTINSNNVSTGDIFFAIHGTKSDGHDYIQKAIDAGASAIISNGRDTGKLSVPQIKVNNTRKAVSAVAAEYYEHPSKNLKVIGITGTNGKTSTASLIKSILEKDGKKTAQIGTLGLIADGLSYEVSLTTPDAISIQKLFSKLLDAEFTHVVMEVSSHSLDQYRVADVDFDIAVFTNMTPEHLDYHGTIEAYYKSKLRLFKMLKSDSTSILNISNSYGSRISSESTPWLISVWISIGTFTNTSLTVHIKINKSLLC